MSKDFEIGFQCNTAASPGNAARFEFPVLTNLRG